MLLDVILFASLVIVGLCLGSFAGASVWRLRSLQLDQDKKNGEDYDKNEYLRLKKISNKSLTNDRSCCLDCGYKLKWYDLLPLFSWLSLGGRCRKCKKPIGIMEPLIEIGVGLFFILSFIFWPGDLNSGYEIAKLALWLVSGVIMAIMFVYDQKWFLLPDLLNYSLIIVGFIYSIIVIIESGDVLLSLISVAGSIFVLSGVYFGLYLLSAGKWIGFGDIKLGLGLALILFDWKLALVALFMANLVGCIIVLPSLLSGKMNRKTHVPFGPFLIIGTIIAKFLGDYLLSFLYF